jgi:tRNA uridine 5-carboxymethylaminomethyl modification enzyme
MLTARAEYRLSLRADNAETRLGMIAREAGCLGAERIAHQDRRAEQRATMRQRLSQAMSASEVAAAGASVSQDGTRQTAWEWLRSDGVELAHVAAGASEGLDTDVVSEVAQDARYAPYVERQAAEVRRLREEETILLPDTLDYAAVPGLSTEMIGRLVASRPSSLAAASRIRGITPAALTAVLLHTRRRAA